MAMELFCPLCDFIFPKGITVGVATAHFETEHGVTANEVRFDLDAACTRCRKRMKLAYSEPAGSGRERHHYACELCKRTFTVTANKKRETS